MTLANVITLMRIALIPWFAVLWWHDRPTAALVVFAVASVSDLVDGLVARLLDQRTRLGALLDPAADKLLLLTAYVIGALLGEIPHWLTVMVVLRDFIIVTLSGMFAFVLRGRLPPERWKPTRLGKYCTFTLVLTIGLALLRGAAQSPSLRPWVGAMSVLGAVLTVISGGQYLSRALTAGKLVQGGAA